MIGIHLGLSLPNRGVLFGITTADELVRLAERAEASGVFGSVWGRRAEGMLAAVLETAVFVKQHERDLAGELIVCVSSAGETSRHDAARAFMAFLGEPRVDFAVVAITTHSAIGVANRGRVDVTITVRGRAAHSSTPWAGVNAVDTHIAASTPASSSSIESAL
jgi:acetylornithine deacetylase/succinyl-diaminopimelate desuccinylase-like protein